MMPMSPTDAQIILKGAEVSGEDLGIGYRRALETIAGMREEWVGQYLDREGKWGTICTYPTPKEVAHHLDYLSWDAYTNTRIVSRYVTTPEEIS